MLTEKYGEQNFTAFDLDLAKFNREVKNKSHGVKLNVKLQLGGKYSWDLELWENDQILLPEKSKFRHIAFKGTANGKHYNTVILSITETSISGFVTEKNKRTYLHTVQGASTSSGKPYIVTYENQYLPGKPVNHEKNGTDVFLEMGLHLDHALYNFYNGDEVTMVAEVLTTIGATSVFFNDNTDFFLNVIIRGTIDGGPVIWDIPNGFCCPGILPMRNLVNIEWSMHRPCIPVDAVVLVTSANWPAGGKAAGGVCNFVDYFPIAYVDLFTGFNQEVSYRLAHEMGHLFGAVHTNGDINSEGEIFGECFGQEIFCSQCPPPGLSCLMCRDGACPKDLSIAFLDDCAENAINLKFSTNCADCLSDPGPNSALCEICMITGMIQADNTLPIPDCDERDIVNYDITVCNSCDPQQLKVQASYDPTKVDLISHSFQSIENISTFSRRLTSTLNFAGEECKTFNYTVKVKTGVSNPIGSQILINDASLLGQPYSDVFITPIGTVIGNGGSISLNSLIQAGTMHTLGASCSGTPSTKRKFQISGILEIDVPYCFTGYDLLMLPGSQILVKSGNTLTIDNSTRLFGCDQLWQGITVEPGAALVMDDASVEDAAYAIDLKGSQNVSITNCTLNNNLIGIYIGDTNPGQSLKIIFDAFWGNSFSTDGNLLPPAANMSPGPALAFGTKPFAGVWIGNKLGSVLHSLDNSFRGISNGIYTKYTSLKVTANSFTDIRENGYSGGLSGFGIRAETGREQGASGIYTLQQSGFGKQPSDQYSFQNCSKAIKTTGMTVDYIKQNAIRAGKGIEVIAPPKKAFIENNLVQVNGTIGIQMTQPSPATEVRIALNNVEVGPTAANGTAIQLNMMGLDPQGAGNVFVGDNEVVLYATNARGLHLTATNSATVKQNLVTVQNSATGSTALLLNNDFNSLLNCNIATAALATSATDAIGFDISDAEGSSYTCNTAGGLGTGVYFQMGSFSPEAFQETSFEGGGVGLKVGSAAAIGPQTHKGNTWGGTFGGFGAQHESNIVLDWDQSRFIVHTISGGYYPSLPIGQNLWFPQLPGTPADDCSLVACAQAGPTPPGNEEKFGFDDGIADYSFSNSDYPTEIGWLAKRYLYRKLTRNNTLITRGSDYETFYDAESATSVGRLLNINFVTAGLYNLDAPTVAQLDGGFGGVVNAMETIGTIDSQLMGQGHDSVLVQQRLQEMLGVENTEADMDSIMSLVFAQRETAVVAIAVQNANITDTMVLETNKKTVNDIFLGTVAIGIASFDSVQTVGLQDVAYQCPLTGGSAVYEARSLLAMVSDVVYDDDALCVGAQAKKGNKETVSTKTGFHLFPNPAKERVTIIIPKKFMGGEIVLTNHLGSIVHRRPIDKESSFVVVPTGSWATGIYHLTVFEDGVNVFADKLVVVHQ